MPRDVFERDMDRTAGLAEFLFTPPRREALWAVWLAELVGFGLWGYGPLPGLRFPFLLGLPSAAAVLLARPLTKAAGGDFVFDNALFLGSADVFLLAIGLKLGALSTTILGLAAALNILIFATLGGLRTVKAGLPALVMPATAYLLWTAVFRDAPPLYAALAAVALAWVLCGIFFAVLSRPLGRIGLDFLDVFARVLGDYAGETPSRVDPFASSGQDTDVLCQAIVIERGPDRDVLLAPWIHPGPLASLGGDLPDRLRRELSDAFERVLFLHTYVDHTRNPAGADAAVAAIAAQARRAAAGDPRPGRTTLFRRAGQGSAAASGWRIGGIDLILTSFAPGKTDDLAAEAGEDLLSAFPGEVVLADGHNSLGPDEGKSRSIAAGDRRLGEMAGAIGNLRSLLEAEEAGPAEVGISEREVGASGIGRCSALLFRISGRTSALIILDANNLPPGVREEVLAALAPLGIEAGEVATTDAHPADIPALTRDGWSGPGRAAVLEAARTAARSALADLRPAVFRYGSERIRLRTWGPLFERIVRVIPKTARVGAFAGTVLFLLYLILAGTLGRVLR